jgi:hypothetical protein
MPARSTGSISTSSSSSEEGNCRARRSDVGHPPDRDGRLNSGKARLLGLFPSGQWEASSAASVFTSRVTPRRSTVPISSELLNGLAESSRTRAPALRPAGTVRAGPSSCDPRHKRSWALDFFTAGLLNGTKVHVLAVIEHGSRRARVLGATEHPVQSPVVQQARNLLMDLDDAGIRARFALHDRDASFSAASGAVFQSAGISVIHAAVQAPR